MLIYRQENNKKKMYFTIKVRAQFNERLQKNTNSTSKVRTMDQIDAQLWSTTELLMINQADGECHSANGQISLVSIDFWLKGHSLESVDSCTIISIENRSEFAFSLRWNKKKKKKKKKGHEPVVLINVPLELYWK